MKGVELAVELPNTARLLRIAGLAEGVEGRVVATGPEGQRVVEKGEEVRAEDTLRVEVVPAWPEGTKEYLRRLTEEGGR